MLEQEPHLQEKGPLSSPFESREITGGWRTAHLTTLSEDNSRIEEGATLASHMTQEFARVVQAASTPDGVLEKSYRQTAAVIAKAGRIGKNILDHLRGLQSSLNEGQKYVIVVLHSKGKIELVEGIRAATRESSN